jgi:hypothetical protein
MVVRMEEMVLIMEEMAGRMKEMVLRMGTGYTSQGSRPCSGRSAGFDLTGPVDFLSAQSHTEL